MGTRESTAFTPDERESGRESKEVKVNRNSRVSR
jgi:hypothetical protein